MDSKEHKEFNLVEALKKSYTKIAIIISIIIIIGMLLTQGLWMNIGLNILYKEYQADQILPNNDVPDGVFILSGNYTYISQWINTSKIICNEEDIKLLAITYYPIEGSDFKDIVIIDTLRGCNKNI